MISIHVLADALSFEWRLCDLAKTALVVLALLSEHLKLLLQIFQGLLDRLLALVSLLISSLERSGKDLTVLGQSIQLFFFAAECKLQLLN